MKRQNKLLFCMEYTFWNMLFRHKEGIVFLQKDSSRHYGNIPCVHAALGQSVRNMIIYDREQKPVNALRLARARVLVQDQGSQMVSNLRKSSGTLVVQLWHSGGWYKKVGYDAPRPGYAWESERKRIHHIHGHTDYMVISYAKLVASYARAFHLRVFRRLMNFGAIEASIPRKQRTCVACANPHSM